MELLLWTLTVLAAILTWRESCVLGELTVLQGSPFLSSNESKAMTRELMCISEDNLSALVWTTRSEKKFKFVDSPTELSTMDCSFDGTDNCTKQWNLTDNWTLTKSVVLPMGPVMDSRWEGFHEYFEDGPLWTERHQRGTIIFSILGPILDLRIQFCNPSSPYRNCYVIEIGKKIGAESSIRESIQVREFYDDQLIPGTDCQGPQVSRQHGDSFWRLVEWKTFTIRYSKRSKIVSVYDEVEKIISCNFTKWETLHTRLWSQHNTSFRLHEYEYLHTSKAQERLLSPWIDVVGSHICIEMVVGMCAECELSIDMISDKEYNITMGHVMSKLSSNGDDLLPWQYVRFNESIQRSFGNRVQFQVVTHLLKADPNPLWAVASIKKCKDSDAVRISTINITQVEERKKFMWPEVGCQKLSYNGGSLVSSNSVIQHELKHDMPLCERSKVGPHCAISCSSIVADANCSKLSICLSEGCTCSYGWEGQNCDEKVLLHLTVKALEKGMVILEWSYPWTINNQILQSHILIERIRSDLRQESNQEREMFEFHPDKYLARNTKLFYLLPSTEYTFSVHAILNEERNISVNRKKETATLAALAFKNDFKITDIPSGHTIQVTLPSITNDTLDSIMHITVNGEVLCEIRTRVSDNLTSLINATDSKSAWIAASFKTVEMERRIFTIGDSRTYNGIYNCPLNPGETYDIVVIVEGGMKTTENMTIVSNVLQVKLPAEWKELNFIWLISIPIIAALVLFTYYAYYRKRNVMLPNSNDYTTAIYDGTVYLDNTYVEPRKQVSHKPPPRKESAHGSYLELTNGTDSTPAEYDYINLVKIEKFEEYVKEAALTGLLEKEQAMLPREPMKPSDYGKLPENKTKNRNEDLVASDDETRVILKKLPGYPYSDYINASYIRGYNRVNAYIATQWPLLQTLKDFWRMIWQEDVHNICLLSNVIEERQRKYEQYWPDVGTERTYGEVIVINIGHKVFADYTIRTLQLTYRQRTRKIKHLHYTVRSDHDLPMYIPSVVMFLKEVLALSLGDGPLVVQSGAGVGQNGIIILCDICLRRAAVERVIDVFAEAERLCKQSPNMLNNKQQYLLAHLAIAGCLVAPQTTLPCDASLSSKMQHVEDEIDVLEQRLRDDAWQDDILRPKRTQKPLSTQDLAKNRYPEIAPAGDSRIFLNKHPDSDEYSEYISAVHVGGVRSNEQYLATQLPLPSTLGDFWRMMAEREVELIVMLQLPDPQDSTCCEIIQGKKFYPVPHLTITAVTDFELDTKYYTRQKVQLSDSSEEPTRTRSVTILKCKGWDCGLNGEPPSPNTLVALWLDTEKMSRGGPTAAVCHDGLTGCGLYLAMSFLLERMSVNRECDIYSAIRAVRRSRPEFMRTQEQIRFLHDAAVEYMTRFETYANFK